MEYSLENLEYRTKLLLGEPIWLNDIKLYPLKLWEIFEISLNKYNLFLSLLSYTKNEIMESLNVVEDIPLYDFVVLNFVSDESNDFRDSFLNILSRITKKKVSFNVSGYFLVGTKAIIDAKNFNDFTKIIKHQNVLKERKNVVVTKKQRDYKEMVEKARKKHKEYIKAIGSQDTDILDIISAVSSKHPSINLFNIQNLTMYQLIDQFKRLNMIDDYFISVDSLLAGAKKNDVNLIHWSKKITD